MITKQQAMDFIYNLSQITAVKLDLSEGILAAEEDSKSSGFYHYKVRMYKCSLEELVMFFIKGYLHSALLSSIPIPVDIGMLEVGQTYKVHIQKDWDHGFFTAKFLGFDEEDDYVVKFENNKPYTKFDIIEIYKVNE